MLAGKRRLLIPHVLLVILVAVVAWAPKSRPGLRPNLAFLIAIALTELALLIALARGRRKGEGRAVRCDMACFVWALMLTWELCTSVLDWAHPVLVPAPENVFATFEEQGATLALNVIYSMRLLAVGFSTGLVAAVSLGLAVGWYPRLRVFFYPIANIMAPIPPVVFSPYLVALMPTFYSASVLVIILGVFWPNFLSTINRVAGIEQRVLDLARTLKPGNWTMITQILLPYILPGTVAGLKVSMTTSLLMLNYAELMGATHGMGYYVQNSITYANYAHAVAGMIVIGLVVTVLNCLVQGAQKHLLWWR